MKCSKLFCMMTMLSSLLICSITYADTCYDPNYDRYYNCQGDEYVAPVAAALLFSALLSNNNGDGDRGHYHRGNHGNHGGSHGGRGGNGRHH